MKFNMWKKRAAQERQWLSVQLGGWKSVVWDPERAAAIPDMERALVEKHNALPAWTLWEQADESAWYGVELVSPHSSTEDILKEMHDAGFEILAFVLYGDSGRRVLHKILADDIEEE